MAEDIAPVRMPAPTVAVRPARHAAGAREPAVAIESGGWSGGAVPDGLGFGPGAGLGLGLGLDLRLSGPALAFGEELVAGPDVADAPERVPAENDPEDPRAADAWRFALAQLHRAAPSCGGASGEHQTLYAAEAVRAVAGERFSLRHPGLGQLDVHSYHDAEGWKILLRCDDEQARSQLLGALRAGAGPDRLTLHVESGREARPHAVDADPANGY